ncbi:MAG: trypsin-like peptidase domain-containing protein [Verrucomicrobia bacterium]|nr:trypsin-like peptidase domain-containing protein [Verrucomicrobiota bacterium]
MKNEASVFLAGLLVLLFGSGIESPCLANTSSGMSGEDSSPRVDASVRAVRKVLPSVVNIGTKRIVYYRDPFAELWRDFWGRYYGQSRAETQYSIGSGVIISEDGYLLTNNHVTRRANQIWVKLNDGRTFEAEVVANDPAGDVAVLKTKADDTEKLPWLEFAENGDLYLGETVLALGNPFGLGGSVSKGILSSKNRRPAADGEPMEIADWLQTDAAINPGSSGGPLINLDAELIGLNVAVYSERQGIGFAVPVSRVKESLSEIFTPETLGSLWFGARIMPSGFEVAEVKEASPAADAGLEKGDVITGGGGKDVSNYVGLIMEIVKTAKTGPVELQIRRGSESMVLNVGLKPESEVFNSELIWEKTGAHWQLLNSELAEALGWSADYGFVITDVEEGGPSDQVGLKRGFLIQSVDGKKPESLVEAAKILYGKESGEPVKLRIAVKSQDGPFVAVRSGTTEVKVR